MTEPEKAVFADMLANGHGVKGSARMLNKSYHWGRKALAALKEDLGWQAC